jgi:hypothetical protein
MKNVIVTLLKEIDIGLLIGDLRFTPKLHLAAKTTFGSS